MRTGALVVSLRGVSQRQGDPTSADALGFRERFSRFGVPGLAMRAARTYIEAAEIAIRYQKQMRR